MLEYDVTIGHYYPVMRARYVKHKSCASNMSSNKFEQQQVASTVMASCKAKDNFGLKSYLYFVSKGRLSPYPDHGEKGMGDTTTRAEKLGFPSSFQKGYQSS